MAIEALLTANPTPGSVLAEPLSAVEIDALPNADRVWATITALKEHYESEDEDE